MSLFKFLYNKDGGEATDQVGGNPVDNNNLSDLKDSNVLFKEGPEVESQSSGGTKLLDVASGDSSRLTEDASSQLTDGDCNQGTNIGPSPKSEVFDVFKNHPYVTCLYIGAFFALAYYYREQNTKVLLAASIAFPIGYSILVQSGEMPGIKELFGSANSGIWDHNATSFKALQLAFCIGAIASIASVMLCVKDIISDLRSGTRAKADPKDWRFYAAVSAGIAFTASAAISGVARAS